ncbi:MAG: hypothetical protein SPL13_04715 [Clostridia bacterium]|nr:hypothetical protein [Clostridia bacterium]
MANNSRARLIAGAEIIYNQFIPYKQMLSYIKKGKAVLNVLAGVSNGIILRDEEAIGMNKVLITDCEALFNSKYYTEEKVIPVTEFENQIDKIKNFDQSKTWICSAEDTTVKGFLELIKKDLF